MFNHYRYPLYVWLTVQTLAMPITYIVQFFRSGLAAKEFLFNLTYLNVLTGYFGSFLVCLPFYLLFWLLYHQLMIKSLNMIKFRMAVFSQLLWWAVLGFIIHRFYPEMIFKEIFWILCQHAALLLFAVFAFSTKKKSAKL